MQEFSEQRIRHILKYSPAILYTCRADADFGATFVSENVTELLGYTARECLETPNFWKENIHPDDRARVFTNYPSFYGLEYYSHEYRFRHKNGSYLWVYDEFRLVCDPQGNPMEVVGSWLDITNRKETEAALQKSETLFRDFFNSNPVATIITSPSGVVHMVNPAFARYTDYAPDEVVGRTTLELGFWRDPAAREKMVAAINEQGSIDNLESIFYGKGNSELTCLVSSRAIEFAGEVGILSIVIDVTEQRKAEEELIKLDQAKSDFISTAAHELRTPLIAVVGYAELLEDVVNNNLTEEQKHSYVSIIQNNAEVLNQLVDDLLDVGRIQVGRSLGVVPKESDLGRVVQNVVKPLNVANQKHEIAVEHWNPLPETIWIDSGRISQVLTKLLDNAIRYSPHGGRISVITTTDASCVTISVADQGIGMSPGQVEHLFDRFYRGEAEHTSAGGLGIGMNIVKQLIADHGGEVSVTSQVDEGTTVTFTLPVKRTG